MDCEVYRVLVARGQYEAQLCKDINGIYFSTSCPIPLIRIAFSTSAPLVARHFSKQLTSELGDTCFS